MIQLSELFDISYGHSLELNRLTPMRRDEGGIAFVSRKMGDNGISAYVAPIPDVTPAPAGELTCALSGNGVLSTFLQEEPFYTGFHVARLKPLVEMTRELLLYYCACIVSNRYRFSYGRQANRTLKSILVPTIDEIPNYVNGVDVAQFDGSDKSIEQAEPPLLETSQWQTFRYDEIFIIKKGYYNKKPPNSHGADTVPFIGATEYDNGVTSYVSLADLKAYSKDGSINTDEPLARKLFPGGCITVSNNGSVGEAFYQPLAFTCTHDVNPLYLKDAGITLSPALGMFLAAVIRADKYRWGYGRKWRPIRMPDSLIRLPVTPAGVPDWAFMEQYIKALSYSSQLQK